MYLYSSYWPYNLTLPNQILFGVSQTKAENSVLVFSFSFQLKSIKEVTKSVAHGKQTPKMQKNCQILLFSSKSAISNHFVSF